jgi:hypothetical protein
VVSITTTTSVARWRAAECLRKASKAKSSGCHTLQEKKGRGGGGRVEGWRFETSKHAEAYPPVCPAAHDGNMDTGASRGAGDVNGDVGQRSLLKL